MRVEIVQSVNSELYQALQRLVPQLTNNNAPRSLDDLTVLLREKASTLMVALDENDQIVGTLTLIVYRVPTGVRSIIEDVIVDETARGQGIGEALMKHAIVLAREKGAANISLTSNPMREAANKLYLRMGFKRRETNAYQMKL